ncbi:hypothetical protein KIW84_060201 [Lathyrus oleraceus]|uniref:Transposase MuDR plant domain-containing protein n=1 Tax=Pisum sativum TaxID=3888 RepID=A0A9D4VZF4_PEA|nr:hypothetical protein KIW84_060201 [Pisum sativum]
MKKSGSQKEKVKYCVSPAMSNRIRLRINHRDKLVETPIKWYVNWEVTEMNWSWDVDYMSYMELDDMIKSGAVELDVKDDVQCTGFKSADVTEQVIIAEEVSIDLNGVPEEGNIDPNGVDEDGVTTNPNGGAAEEENIDPNGVAEDDVSIDPNGVVEEENTDPNGVAEDDITTDPNGVADEGTIDPNGVAEDDVTIDSNVVAEEGITDIGEDYVASEGSFEDSEYQFSEEFEESEMDWTKVLPQETLSEASSCQNKKDQDEMVHGDGEGSYHLYTPPGSDDEDEGMKYPTYKSDQGMKFQLGMMFTNKEMIRDVVKDYAMENQKNVFIKKNDFKRIMVKPLMVVSST